MKFKDRIVINANIIKISLLFSVFPRENLTSFLKVFTINFFVFIKGYEIFHMGVDKISIAIGIINHEVENKEVLGSNTENRFVIILCFFLF